MSRFNATAAGVLLVTLVASGLPASADLVTFDFVVQLTSVMDSQNVLGGTVAVGDEVTGQFTLDTSTPDWYPASPNLGTYSNPITSLTGSVGGVAFTGPGPTVDQITIRVPGIGPYEFQMFEDPEFLGTRADFRLWLRDSTRSWTEGDALPTVPFPHFDFSFFELAAQAPGGFVRLEGVVTSFTPEPGSLAFLGLGVLTALGRTRG